MYLAHQEPLGRMVALKVLAPPMDINADERDRFVKRFLLEAKTLGGLDHPHIVTVYDYGQTDAGDFYIAMEYVDGVRFNDLLRHGRLEVHRALGLIRQVCSALQYAHNRGVIHRDIKNSNVLVKRDANGNEVVKVVDFGIVKLRNEKVDLTQVGIILGSPHFMAPEQAQGKDVDHRVDVYAVGVLMYCALAGRYPFNGSHSTAILTAHLTRDPPTFSEVAPDLELPPGLEDMVRRCLLKRPAERYPDMASIIVGIDAYLAGQEGVPGEELGTMSREAVRKPGVLRNPLVAMTAGAFVALLLVTIGALGLLLLFVLVQDANVGGTIGDPVPPDSTAAVEEAGEPVVNTTTRKLPEGPVGDDGTPDPAADGGEVDSTETGASVEAGASTGSSVGRKTPKTSSGSGSSRPSTANSGSGSASSSAGAGAGTNRDEAVSGAEPTEVTGGTDTPSDEGDPPPSMGSDLLDPWAD